MDALTTFLETTGFFDAWRIGYPLILGLGALAAWTVARLTYAADAVLEQLYPYLPNGLMRVLDLLVALAIALLAAPLLFHPATPMAALTAGFTWTTVFELVVHGRSIPSGIVPRRTAYTDTDRSA